MQPPETLYVDGEILAVLWTLTEGRFTTVEALTADGLVVSVTVPFAHSTWADMGALLARIARIQRDAREVAACVGRRPS